MKQLLFLLVDDADERVLFANRAGQWILPIYGKQVDENVGFDDPSPYNEYFAQMIGFAVYRKYCFGHHNAVVFVYERAEKGQTGISEAFCWVPLDALHSQMVDPAIRDIVLSIQRNYHSSVNMPWMRRGFQPYFQWMRGICKSQGIEITGDIVQVKNAYVSTVFRVHTHVGDIYMKIPGTLYINELQITQSLEKTGILKLPTLIGSDIPQNVMLMRDMQGENLTEDPDEEALHALLRAYAAIQSRSISHTSKLLATCNDYRIGSMYRELRDFPDRVYQRLQGTPHEITQAQVQKLSRNIAIARTRLARVSSGKIPATLHHGDLRPGNIRVGEGGFIFYDWSCSAVSHPFIDISLFLHTIRRGLPRGARTKDALMEGYLKEWRMYGTQEVLQREFELLDGLKELFMSLYDFDWLEAIWAEAGDDIDPQSADGWLFARRLYYFARVLHRFMEMDLA